MLRNYFTTFFRHVQRQKLNAFFRVGGLVLALFSFLVIALYVAYQLSYDRYHYNYQNIYRLNAERFENGAPVRYGVSHIALGPMIKAQFPEVEAFTRLSPINGSHIRYKDKVVYCGVFPVDSTLFDVLSFQFVDGDQRALSKPRGIVLNQTIASKVFGSEDPMHKLIALNSEQKLYEVTGVIEDMKPNTHFIVDGFFQMTDDYDFSPTEISSPVDFIDHSAALYLRFRDDARPLEFEAKLESMLDQHVSRKDRERDGYRLFLQPVSDIYLDPQMRVEFARKGSTLYLYLFLTLGAFLLIVASINYINLSVADLVNRCREIGIRKTMGAGKMQIAFQVILESALYCFVSILLAVGFLYLLFPTVASVLESGLRFTTLGQPSLLFTAGAALFLLLVCSTAFPAYLLATSNTSQDLKGVPGYGRHNALGRMLLVAQFAISIICIAATLTMDRQLDYIHNKNLGFDRKNLLVISLPEDFSVTQMKRLKQGVQTLPGVTGVSNSSFRIGGGFWKDVYTLEIDGQMKTLELHEVFSDDDLFTTLGMKLVDGRLFDAAMPADSGSAFILNETAVRDLGLKNPVGKKILTHPEEKGKWEGRVVGVVGDINISTLHERVRPLVMRLPWQREYPETFLYVRVDNSSTALLDAIRKTYAETASGYPLDMEFVDDHYNNQYKKENKAFASLQFGAIVIVLISSLGIFSLSIYMSARRMREFGIRKVLGATISQITVMHIAYFLRLTVIANLIACPLCYLMMRKWLDGFAYRTDLKIDLFIVVTLVSFLMVIVSAGHSAWKAGTMNPVDVIQRP